MYGRNGRHQSRLDDVTVRNESGQETVSMLPNGRLTPPLPCVFSVYQVPFTSECPSSPALRIRTTRNRIIQGLFIPSGSVRRSESYPFILTSPLPNHLRIPGSTHPNFEMRVFNCNVPFYHENPGITQAQFSHLQTHPQPIRSTSLPSPQRTSARNTFRLPR